MIVREIILPSHHWSIRCYLGYRPSDAEEICRALTDMGCKGTAIKEAHAHLSSPSDERGLTYSNLSSRTSLLAVGRCQTISATLNTISHELLHVVAHICEQDHIDMFSEEPCYMLGDLCERLFNS